PWSRRYPGRSEIIKHLHWVSRAGTVIPCGVLVEGLSQPHIVIAIAHQQRVRAQLLRQAPNSRRQARQGTAACPPADRYQKFAITCSFHDDGFWADLKTNHPAEWADAVAFDDAIRHGSAKANADGHPLRGTYYLHASRVPLDEAVLRPSSRRAADRPGCG